MDAAGILRGLGRIEAGKKKKSIESLKQITYALASACVASGLDVSVSEDLICSSAREWAQIQRMKS